MVARDPADDHALQRLHSACAPVLDVAGLLSGQAIEPRYCRDWTGGEGRPLAVLRPRSPDEVARVMALLNGLGQPVVVQGGMTGLVGSCVPQPGEVVLSMERLRTIEELDTEAGTVRVQAGVALQTLQEHVQAQGWFFPVDIGSRGTCQIGGLIATNAGGNRVLRYGMTRQSVLGLEVVLPDGSVVSRLGKALKDNAGYDLKHAFIGSEGTLGVITRAQLALQPLPSTQQTALVSVASFSQVVALLALCRQRLGAALSSFEVMWRDYFDTVTVELRKGRASFTQPGSHLVLIESLGNQAHTDAETFQQTMVEFMEQVPAAQVLVAQSLADSQQLWALRDASGEAAQAIAPYAGFDVSLPVSCMQTWTQEVHAQLAAQDLRQVQTYGHVGDGNLHLCVGGLHTPGAKTFVSELVHSTIGQLAGSISGEHGIGLLKKKYLAYCRSPAELALMRTLKRSLDPQQLLNRGRIFDLSPLPSLTP
jgi:FAD/FMN-containing dehydrogenase